MMVSCTRYDEPGDQNARLLAALHRASGESSEELSGHVTSLYDYDGQLWATWRSAEPREAHGEALTRAWKAVAGEQRVLHLLVVEEQYDYQEDVLDNVAQGE